MESECILCLYSSVVLVLFPHSILCLRESFIVFVGFVPCLCVTVFYRWNALEFVCLTVEGREVVSSWDLFQIKLQHPFLHLPFAASKYTSRVIEHARMWSVYSILPHGLPSDRTSLFSHQWCMESSGCSRSSLITWFFEAFIVSIQVDILCLF